MRHKNFIFILTFIMLFGYQLTAQDIHQAIQQGNLDLVKSILISNPGLLEMRNENNLTPLLSAAIQGNIEIARFLIEKGADVHAGDNEGSNALHNAAAGGRKEMIRLLVSKGMRVNDQDDRGMTALHFASSRGHLDCAELLVSLGADVSAEESNQRTPLFFAAGSGDLDLCRLLIENGAKVAVSNKYGRTPLTYAIWRNHESIVDLLLNNGAEVNLKDVDGNTPLHQVCIDGQPSIAQLLIDHDADIYLKDAAGHTSLHLAAYYGQSGIVELLVAQGMDVNAVDEAGDTPIHGAAWCGDRATAELLLKKEAQLNVKNSQGKTPLDYAVQVGYSDIVQLFKTKGAIMREKSKEHRKTTAITNRNETGKAHPIKMTVLYDNYIAAEGTKAEWGFSCLIEGTEKTILFDTGGDAEVLMHNIDFLNVDLKAVDQIVISHNHWDHTGGLASVLQKNPNPPVYVPYSFPFDFVRQVEQAEGKVIPVKDPIEICENVYLTGQMGDQIKEQSLIIDTNEGSVIVTGCSHQGIVNILKKTREILNKDILLVFGGFHLMQHSDQQVNDIIQSFRELGVKKCGATHCTGDRQIDLFKKAFSDDYVTIGTGRIIRITEEGIKSKIAK